MCWGRTLQEQNECMESLDKKIKVKLKIETSENKEKKSKEKVLKWYCNKISMQEIKDSSTNETKEKKTKRKENKREEKEKRSHTKFKLREEYNDTKRK